MKELFTYLSFVLISFSVVSQTCLPNNTTFWSQADIDNFLVNNPTCTTIEGELFITGNDITNLNGLQNITTYNKGLWIEDCPLLTSFNGLDSINYIGDYLEIGNLPLIQNFDEFSHLTYVGGPLDIVFMPSLISLTGLENITSSPTYLILWGNSSLTNLSGLEKIQSISTTLNLQNNILLTDISALENVDLSALENLIIKDNPQLVTCNQKSICDALTNGITNSKIENNHINGCNTISEIVNSCGPNSVEEINLDRFNFHPNPAKTKIIFDEDVIKNVKIFSQTGQLLLTQPNITTSMDVSYLKPGFYFITLEYSNTIQTKKIIIVGN